MQNQCPTPRSSLSATERSRLISLYRSGQLSQVDFAKQHGLNVHTLRQWLYRADPKPPSKRPASDVSFREVPLRSLVPHSWAAEVTLPSGVNVRFSSSASSELIAQLLARLSSPC